MTTRIRLALIGVAAAALTLFVVTTALAVDDAKPAPDCHGVLVEDGKSDGADSFTVGFRTSDATEIERTFFKYDASKGAEASTLNMVVKNLSLTPPAGATGLIWDFKFLGPDGATHFVRAIADYSGGSAFEYGTLDDSLPVQRYVPEGTTPGKFFEGPDGVIQLVVPPDFAKAGTALKSVIGESQLAFQIIPSAVPSPPTRGLSNVYDDTAGKSIAVGECTPEQLNQGGGGDVLGSATRSLPVKLSTTATTAKKIKKAKSLSLKLKSTEKITALSAKLLKGKTTYGKGKLAQIDGSATLKLRLSKKLKKGSYTVTLAGTDSGGNALTTTAKYKVKQ
jgi:hypothetical protein